jgi:uncharacterized protein YndB with AHSA1/START domain
MPSFTDNATTTAPPEEVWKVLYDPSRIPEWWADVATVEPEAGKVTLYADGWPDFPMPQLMTTSRDDGTVQFSCQVSDLETVWRLIPRDDGGTDLTVDVEIPEREAARLGQVQDQMARSIRNLADVACRT